MQKDISFVTNNLPVQPGLIERYIHVVRGQKAMADTDLAELYQVPVKVLNQAVQRNIDRFPKDFMFQLNQKEAFMMRSQNVTASKRNIRYQPLVFTEHGIAMISSVLKSKRAIQMNILIIRAFIAMRKMVMHNSEMSQKMEKLEHPQLEHGSKIDMLYTFVKKLILDPIPITRKKIGFDTSE